MKKKFSLSTTQIILLGFLLAIAAGTLLLSLPISTASGERADFITALFTATTSLCVTGLVVADTFSFWSTFGHIVILVLIQLGGLGIVSLTTGVMLLVGRRVTLKNRLLLGDAFNLDTLSGLLRFLKKMFRGTFTAEAIGAVLYSFVFVPEYGLRGIWISVFTAVSAFCNAGIDIIGPQSLIPYADNPLVVLTTSMLIIFGGLGFLVWWDIADAVRKKPPLRQLFRRLKLHSKIVLISTASLLFGGTAVILLLEYSNPETLAAMPFGQKLLSAFFQSVTLRTAGFMTVSQSSLREATALFSIILMFIGGSPIGTAGGIKTTTAATLIIAARSYAKGKRSATAFKRTLPNETIIKALTVVLISTAAAFIAVLLLSATQEGSIIDIAYEAVSALGTVGLTRSLTPSLDTFGKIVIIICMYLGRVGPISLVIALSGNRNPTYTVLPEEDVRVG